MMTVLLAIGLTSSAIHLEAKPSQSQYKFGDKVRIEIFAVNDGEEDVVIGKSAIGNYASGRMQGGVAYVGGPQPALNSYNPDLGQIGFGRSIPIQESDFAVIPPKGRALVYFEEIKGEWKDGHTPWSEPRGIDAISVPARRGAYRFAYTYTFNRKKAQQTLNDVAFRPGYKLDEHVIPDLKMDVVFVKNAKKLFDSAVEGTWKVSGEFKIDG